MEEGASAHTENMASMGVAEKHEPTEGVGDEVRPTRGNRMPPRPSGEEAATEAAPAEAGAEAGAEATATVAPPAEEPQPAPEAPGAPDATTSGS